MGARERAREDEAAGDLGSARRRLMSLLDSQGYDPLLCYEIGMLCLRMNDPLEAGRWLLIANTRSAPLLQVHIDSFLASCRQDSAVVLSRLPRAFKTVTKESLLPEVKARLDAIGLDMPPPPTKARPLSPRKAKLLDGIALLGCAVVTLAAATVFVAGLTTIRAWLFD